MKEKKDISAIMKVNNAQFYYALLEFKDRFADEIYNRYGIERDSINNLGSGDVKLIVDFMLEKAMAGI